MNKAARYLFLGALAAGSVLITYASLPYFFGEDLHPFIIEKLPVPLEDVWMGALHVHVAAAAFSLPACLLLLSRRVMRTRPRLHRILGRVVGGVILVALVPAGAWLALFAKGGLPSTAGFLVSGAIVFAAMVMAIVRARQGRHAEHRRFVLHVVAQMSVAVTSRAMLVALSFTALDPLAAYVAALWIPVVVSALAAERIANPGRNHVAPRLVLRPAAV